MKLLSRLLIGVLCILLPRIAVAADEFLATIAEIHTVTVDGKVIVTEPPIGVYDVSIGKPTKVGTDGKLEAYEATFKKNSVYFVAYTFKRGIDVALVAECWKNNSQMGVASIVFYDILPTGGIEEVQIVLACARDVKE